MKRSKNILAAILIGILLIGAFTSGQAGSAAAEATIGEEKRLQIVSTIFPGYDFAKALAGDGAQVRLLLSPGSESHSYEPTPQDIIAIQNADLFVIAGGESEHWITEILSSMGDKAPAFFSMLDCVEGLAEETSLSMQTEEADHHDEHGEDEHHEHGAAELDEHVWTSPKRAIKIVGEMLVTLTKIDPQNASAYERNAALYLSALAELDAAIEQAVAGGSRNKIIFGDRFPFRYLAFDYGLTYDAAFPGCSEDSEPNAQTVISLIREITREKIPVVFYVELSNRKTADILVEETGAKPLLLHSCHNVSVEEMQSGATYLTLMQGNVSALEEALR